MALNIFKKVSTRFRISLGLSSMLVSLVLFAALLGLVPDRNAAIRDGRALFAESVAVNSSIFITTSDIRRMDTILQVLVDRNEDLLSAAVRHADGRLMTVIGEHQRLWQDSGENTSRDGQIVVPIYEGQQQWGQVELSFEPLLPNQWYGWIYHPVVMLMAFLSIAGFILYYLYMGKMLKQLDPSQAIPDRVRSALDTMAEGLLVIDAKQNIVLANQAFSNIPSVNPDKLIGLQVSRFGWLNQENEKLDKEQAPWTRTLDDAVVRTAEVVRLAIGENETRTFMLNCSPVLTGSGKPAGALISFDDITELEKKEIELRLSRDEAEQANRFKSEFLANMSHEIRTPMNAILGFAEVLKRGYDRNSKDSIRYLNTISSSGNHLLGLINDILDLSKVEAGRIEIEKVHTPVHTIIQEVIQIMRVKADEKQISLEYQADGPLPATIETDAAKLRQIITNLVGNAIKFTDRGGIVVTSRFESAVTGPMVHISVRDSGIGMTEQQALAVFNPFTQADSSITRRFGGTGLGLTISKSFAEAMGGDIRVVSKEGEGSDFQVTVPAGNIGSVGLLSVEEIMSMDWAEQTDAAVRWKFTEATALVVDDGEENRDLLKVVMSDAGVQVFTAENGQQALDFLAQQTVDVVLMDVQMPVMDGLTAAGIMRERYPHLPVIALTADAMSGVQQQCLSAGYSDYLSKPVDIDLLMERLGNYLTGSRVDAGQMIDDKLQDNVGWVADAAQEEKIHSSLPVHKEQFRRIVEKFIERMHGQVEVIGSAWRDRDYDRLKKLGHWLKGSSGSVGFQQLMRAGSDLEQYAIDRNDEKLESTIEQIGAFVGQMEVAPGTETRQRQSAKVQSIQKDYAIPDKVLCRLPVTSPRLRPIIERFLEQLDDWLGQIDAELEREDCEHIHKFAQWLKASGGSVGFDAFTEPAKDLANHCQEEELDDIRYTIGVIKTLSSRIDIDKE
ncbi:response regulator [Marinobacter sp. 1_MG-2023]|uniref:response regulator n=1 Tax=Marinobacter sp. 1_MG-2023 TaxID=3062627 RepID=UPI0026E145E4|nr:response regulator [Marinobacter sp. 1_MG-2023]MDO6823776.1 response regulator [Marinobacter sp. 1_MG-2023]